MHLYLLRVPSRTSSLSALKTKTGKVGDPFYLRYPALRMEMTKDAQVHRHEPSQANTGTLLNPWANTVCQLGPEPSRI